MKTDVFVVMGMYCPKCAAKIDAALQTVTGMSSHSVTLKSGEVRVEYDDMKTNRVRIVDAIRRSGFTAKIFTVAEPEYRISKARQRIEANKQARRTAAMRLPKIRHCC